MYVCMYIYIYIYIYIHPPSVRAAGPKDPDRSREVHRCYTANLRTKMLDFTGFDSSRTLVSRGGIPRPKGNFPESLSQAILVGIILVGRLGVPPCAASSFLLKITSETKSRVTVADMAWRCSGVAHSGVVQLLRATPVKTAVEEFPSLANSWHWTVTSSVASCIYTCSIMYALLSALLKKPAYNPFIAFCCT